MKTDLLMVPNIGKKTKQDLISIGITCVEDLKEKNPEELYQQCCLKKRFQIDRCQLYVLRAAVYYANHDSAENIKWWDFKD